MSVLWAWLVEQEVKECCRSFRLDPRVVHNIICDPPQDFDAKGDSTLTARFHLETKYFILARLRRASRSA